GSGVFNNPDSPLGYTVANAGTGAINVTTTSTRSEAFTIKIPAATVLKETLLSGVLSVPVVIGDNTATNLGSLSFKLTFNSCLAYSSVTPVQTSITPIVTPDTGFVTVHASD